VSPFEVKQASCYHFRANAISAIHQITTRFSNLQLELHKTKGNTLKLEVNHQNLLPKKRWVNPIKIQAPKQENYHARLDVLIVFTQTKVANRNIGIEAKRCVEKQGYSASKPPLSEEESTVPWMFFRAAVEDSISCILQVSVSGSSAKV
jgi:hypothetical protein